MYGYEIGDDVYVRASIVSVGCGKPAVDYSVRLPVKICPCFIVEASSLLEQEPSVTLVVERGLIVTDDYVN